MIILAYSMSARGSAAALLRDGRPVATAREEWLSRVPCDTSPPSEAIACCLESAGLELEDVELVVCTGADGGCAESTVPLLGRHWRAPITTVPHAKAALASAYCPSPFEQAAVLVMNGPGHGVGSLAATAAGTDTRIVSEAPSPHGPGALYAALAARLGRHYPRDVAELMDLARLGQPHDARRVRDEWMELRDDGTCRFHAPANGDESAPRDRAGFSDSEINLARSVQHAYEEALLHAARTLRKNSKLNTLVLAGEAALNPAAVGRLLREGIFDEVWIPPAPCDTALGAALDTWYRASGRPRDLDSATGYTGPVFTVPALESYLVEMKIGAHRFRAEELLAFIAQVLAEGQIVGWFQGHMWAGHHGFAARALLADPRSGSIRDLLNTRVKRRSGFRTFSAAVLAEEAGNLFDLRQSMPNGCVAAIPARPRLARKASRRHASATPSEGRFHEALPAVTLADGTVALRLVDRQTEPLFHALLSAFAAHTNCPLLLADSLCLESESPAATPRDAYALFMQTDVDYLVMGPFLLDKRQQPLWGDQA